MPHKCCTSFKKKPNLMIKHKKGLCRIHIFIRWLLWHPQLIQNNNKKNLPAVLLQPASVTLSKVWPITVKPRGLGSSKSLTGENRLCLTATSLILVRVGAGNDLPSVTIPLLSVRRFGHLEGLFYLELGRSAPNGPGEIWMETNDQGN